MIGTPGVIRVIAFLGLVSSLLPTGGTAQPADKRTARQIAEAENECRAQGGKMFSGAVARERQFAIGLAKACPDTGAALLAALWRQPPSDSAVMGELVFHSAHVIDARIGNAALQTLQDRSQPLKIRVAALRTVYSQITKVGRIDFLGQSKRYFVPTDPTKPRTEEDVVLTSTSRLPLAAVRGRQEVTESVRLQLISALRAMQSAGTDDRYLLLCIKEVLGMVDSR